MIINIKRFLLRILTFFLIVFSSNMLAKDVWLNIFVHGIVKLPFSLKDFAKIISNNVDGSTYALGAEYLRSDPEFYIHQPIQELGLKPIDMQMWPGNAAGAISNVYEKEYRDLGFEDENLYYTFGWSGILSRFDLEVESKNFYDELEKEVNRLRKLGINPRIRAIAFSHGGNIVLYLANYSNCQNISFFIDESIFIGMPVQKETDYLSTHPIFKSIYHFYSMSDLPQTVELLTTKYWYSERKFYSRECFKVPDKLKQIQVRFVKIIKPSSECFKYSTRFDPKHMELWKFGWIYKGYRRGFPIEPLPVSAILPLIVQGIKEIPELSDDLAVEINMQIGCMKIFDNKNKSIYELPFYSCDQMLEMQNYVLDYKPLGYNYCDFQDLIKRAILYAIEQKEKCKTTKNIFK